MKVKIKKLSPDAKMPEKATKGDFCYDLFASSDAEPVYDKQGNLIPKVLRYHTGIAFEIVRDDEMPDNNELILDIDARPRSSIYKTGLSLCNCEGTIDEPYRGEVMAMFYDIVSELPKYKKGDKIVQIKLGFTIPLEFEWCEELNMNTERAKKGFGEAG